MSDNGALWRQRSHQHVPSSKAGGGGFSCQWTTAGVALFLFWQPRLCLHRIGWLPTVSGEFGLASGNGISKPRADRSGALTPVNAFVAQYVSTPRLLDRHYTPVRRGEEAH